MATFIYNHAKKMMLSGMLDVTTSNSLCVMLVSGTYTPDKDAHKYTGDIGANEVSDSLSSYRKGGTYLTSNTLTQNNTLDRAVFTAANVSWSSSTITASGAVIYKSGTTPSTSYLIQYVDFGANQSSSNGTFQITWNSDGIFNIAES